MDCATAKVLCETTNKQTEPKDNVKNVIKQNKT